MNDLLKTDIETYLRRHEEKDLLRFITCGSVDDGKSTLIGRLLHDTKAIFEDQLAAVTRDSRVHGTTGDVPDLALLVDGLQSEREQGITIDVAYRYFSTDKRKFIIADTPGHEQYTRNMATGASTASLAIILIDARYGVQTQTRRHSYLVSLLGIRHVIVAVNKMDLMDFDESVFERIRQDYVDFSASLGISDVRFIPLSALNGDNVASLSPSMPWYAGPTLLDYLESVEISHDDPLSELRFPVQYVNRPHLDFRGYCGTVAAGCVQPGQTIRALPSGKTATVKSIVCWEGDLAQAVQGQAVTITLNEEIDISRGDMLVPADSKAVIGQAFDAHLVWMHEAALQVGKVYDFKLGTTFVAGRVTAIQHQIDVNTLEQHAVDSLPLNGIAKVTIELESAVVLDAYTDCRATGSFIVVDRLSNVTVGAGMVREPAEKAAVTDVPATVNWAAFEQDLNALVRKHFPHWGARDIRELLSK